MYKCQAKGSSWERRSASRKVYKLRAGKRAHILALNVSSSFFSTMGLTLPLIKGDATTISFKAGTETCFTSDILKKVDREEKSNLLYSMNKDNQTFDKKTANIRSNNKTCLVFCLPTH